MGRLSTARHRAVHGLDRLWRGLATPRGHRWALLGLLVLGLVAITPAVLRPSAPNSDGLFFEVQALQLEGTGEPAAMHAVFDSPRAEEVAKLEDTGVYRTLDPVWQDYTKQFFERRWTVPAMAAVLDSVAGLPIPDGIQDVSLLAYALLGPVMFLLLRRRFDVPTSLVASLAVLALPPLYHWSNGQYSDSWGVLLQTLGMLAAVLVLQKGLRWLALWVAAMVLLSITRDATMILGIAAVLVLVANRRRSTERLRALWLVGTGAVAAVPALLLGGAPVRQNLAYIYNGYQKPTDDSWSFVAHGYLPQLRRTIDGDLTYPLDFGVFAPVFFVGLAVIVAAVVVTVLRRPAGDPLLQVARGSVVGCVLLVLVANNPQGYRLELVFVPVYAVGVALAVQWLAARIPVLRDVARPPVAVQPA